MGLTVEDINKLIKFIYHSNSMQINHGTDWTDQMHRNRLKKRIAEIKACTEHDNCQLFNKLAEMRRAP